MGATLLLFLTGGVKAQDIIVTKDSERIDAKIIEVSEQEVKYKKHNNLDGPTFVLSTAKISSVIYANGNVQSFDSKVVKDTGQKTVHVEHQPYNHLYRGLEYSINAGSDYSGIIAGLGIGKRFSQNFYTGIFVGLSSKYENYKRITANGRVYLPFKNQKFEFITDVHLGVNCLDWTYYKKYYYDEEAYYYNYNTSKYIDYCTFILQATPGIQIPISNNVDFRIGIGLTIIYDGTTYGSGLEGFNFIIGMAFHRSTMNNKHENQFKI